MPVSGPSKSPDAQSQEIPELEQEPVLQQQFAWLKELRFWLSALFGFALMIGYKSLFPTQAAFVDIGAVVVASLFAAIMAGFPISKVVIGIINGLLQHSNY
jgi:hypothetical protein